MEQFISRVAQCMTCADRDTSMKNNTRTVKGALNSFWYSSNASSLAIGCFWW